MKRLNNPIKHYAWGSPEWIPQFMGQVNPGGRPWAEVWMGIHPEGPSETEEGTLSALINQDPAYYVGAAVAECFGTLPFLFKLLAAERPLSIQAHPSLIQARSGWERENREGISLKAPNRNYKDPNHKPEILCALTPFKALCGFREPGEIREGLVVFSQAAPEPLKSGLASLALTLQGASEQEGLGGFLKALFDLSPELRRGLSEYTIQQASALSEKHPEGKAIWKQSAAFAEQYPGDPAVIAPLYLNLVELQPGEGVYLPAGVLHAYIHGFGVELMANSDNVLRGGLTTKHVDVAELLRILNCSVLKPAILKPPEVSFFRYPTPCREFSLSRMRCLGDTLSFPETGPSIVLVTEGRLTISGRNTPDLILEQGESVFIPAGDGSENRLFTGTYSLYAAGIGSTANGGSP
ncbi:MAG: mannose-6-phosphate isomerase, class I [Treponema sp.]|jgi:mannose-6-phosphate isomerase|nr:mannose-6-phosphate isomerase, class I [Treponema sp.]